MLYKQHHERVMVQSACQCEQSWCCFRQHEYTELTTAPSFLCKHTANMLGFFCTLTSRPRTGTGSCLTLVSLLLLLWYSFSTFPSSPLALYNMNLTVLFWFLFFLELNISSYILIAWSVLYWYISQQVSTGKPAVWERRAVRIITVRCWGCGWTDFEHEKDFKFKSEFIREPLKRS